MNISRIIFSIFTRRFGKNNLKSVVKMSSCEKKSTVPTCYQMKLGNYMNDHQCQHRQAKKSESSKYNDDKLLERKQKESEEELENAKRTLKTTENIVRQSRSGVRGCHNQDVKKTIKPCLNQSIPPCKSGAISGKEAIKKLARVPTSKECQYSDAITKGKVRCEDLSISPLGQNKALAGKIGTQTKESKCLPKKPTLTSDEISELIKQETNDVENAWIIASESKETYKKPCPKQQKARDAVRALIETKKEEPLPCFTPPVINETLLFIDPDPEDISPEVAASMIYTQERGIKMISCPEDTVKHLFPEQFGRANDEETEKKKGSGEPEVEVAETAEAEVTEDEVDDSVFTRNMSQQRENSEDDRASANVHHTPGKKYDKKREFFLQEKAAKCVNRVQLRGNFAPWFPGYFVAFPDHAGKNTIQLAKSPSSVFQKAWMAAKPSNVQTADLYLVE